MFAHYFASKKVKFVILSTSAVPTGTRIKVQGKVEARKVAAQHGAQPYNF